MKITIVGCGNMGIMFAHAFVKDGIVSRENLYLLEKSEVRKKELSKIKLGQVVNAGDYRILQSDVFIIAVKPQGFPEMAGELKSLFANAKCIVSIMAGVKIKQIKAALGNPNIVRAMPNAPCELGMGMTGFTATKSLAREQVHMVENLLASTGRAVFFQSEDLIDACTALSGSGPAYFYYIIKNMIEAGMKLGLEEATAAMLAKQTMLGSFHLMNVTDKSLDQLIKSVASKGGTTQAALDSFEKSKMGDNLQQGIICARDRARELSE